MIAPEGRARRVLEVALALEGAERAAFLERRCARDRALRDEVETLLEHGQALGDFLDRPLGAVWPEAADLATDGEPGLPFERLGDFRLLAPLGSGGMALVFLAEQDQPRRRVALKLVRPELAAEPEFRRRFVNEIEALGRLEHAGIARLYQAGTAETPLGPRSFFAMELVEGRTILRYAEEERLGRSASCPSGVIRPRACGSSCTR
jgi:serine/threonine protein kinase